MAAPPATLLTVADGGVSLIRGTSRYVAGAGVRLQGADILEVSQTGLAQVEFEPGSAVSLGPAGRAMLMPAQPAGARPALFVLSGTAKLTARSVAPLTLSTAWFTASIEDATVIVRSSAAGADLFVETGSVTAERGGTRVAVEQGEFVTWRAGAAQAVSPRPPSQFVAAMPRPFLDPLPSLRDRFPREAVPTAPSAFSYAEVEAWLDSVPAVRRVLVTQWRAKAKEPAFRKALEANLKRHPEWEGVLSPPTVP